MQADGEGNEDEHGPDAMVGGESDGDEGEAGPGSFKEARARLLQSFQAGNAPKGEAPQRESVLRLLNEYQVCTLPDCHILQMSLHQYLAMITISTALFNA